MEAEPPDRGPAALRLTTVKSNSQNTRHTETLVSACILTVLALIAAWVLFAQKDFNPAVEALNQIRSGHALSSDTSATPAPALFPFPADLIPMGPAERFTAATLSDKINGKAELYLSAGFVQLHSQRVKSGTSPEFWAEMFVYDMGQQANAFAVFSAQRREGVEPGELGAASYATANAFFAAHGKFYLEIISASQTAASDAILRQLAQNYIKAHPQKAVVMAEKDLFPAEGLETESLMLIAQNAFGLDRMNRVYTARYGLAQGSATAFISRRDSAAEARELADALHNFFVAFGGVPQDWDEAVKNARMIEILDQYEVVLTRGPFLAGVHEAESPETARMLARLLAQKLQEATDGAD